MSRALPPDDARLDAALDEAEDALDRGDPSEALSACERVLASHADHPGALYLAGEALHELGDLEAAEDHYRRCTQIVPDHALSWSGLSACLFDQLRFDDCARAVERAIRVDDANPEAYYLRALLRERRGDATGAARDYRRAHRFDPERYAAPTPLDDATIEAVVVDALRDCPDEVREAIRNVPILLEELPSDEVCLSFDPPRSPIDIVGLFTGPNLLERSFTDPWSSVPATITLYRKNLERLGPDRERLLEEIRVTLLHEIGHYLGLSEEDLEARGLD
jgi:predicted Zn-dependent protease with MMP-like domain